MFRLFLVLPVFYSIIWEKLCRVSWKAFFISHNEQMSAFCGALQRQLEKQCWLSLGLQYCAWFWLCSVPGRAAAVPDQAACLHQARGLPGAQRYLFPFHVCAAASPSFSCDEEANCFCKLLWGSWMQMQLRVRLGIVVHSAAECDLHFNYGYLPHLVVSCKIL